MGAPPSSYITTDSATIVRAFFAALEDRAVTQALTLTDDRWVWRNTGLPTVRGKLAARVLKGLDRDWMGFSADFHHIVGDGDVVLTERTDYLRIGPIVIDFWVCGTFEVVDGKITLWDDHFSFGNVLMGTLRGLTRPRRVPSRR
ncbi:epoxide hydrolase [Nocardioides humilatus]|uniref:Epoxide hydrolase n=1 Tax=Nocardioides humilatus TaxID=2607660 RepID=A0A5B1LF93_9ACTN|nr:limonene-1,2-epoxide hydrolase family protein [Nocardioides humilatus]KAA1418848.1 epoxide hydrolase [Nocardioides humilatus]